MRVPVNRVDYLFAAGHRPAVDRHDGVTVLQPGLFRRTRHPVARIEAVVSTCPMRLVTPLGTPRSRASPASRMSASSKFIIGPAARTAMRCHTDFARNVLGPPT